jgi:high-affinity iron transporter
MFASAVIVFREVLEAALILSIVAAATRGVRARSSWLLGGVAAGLLGAVVVAAFASSIADALEGVGQEIFNASVLGLAVLMLGWHNIWMQRHGRELAAHMTSIGQAASTGAISMVAVSAAVALAVLREGSEIVLFLFGISGGGSSVTDIVAGSTLGITLGAAAGYALYTGLIAIPVRKMFAVTGWLILLLAAGMAAGAARFLVQADVLPSLGNSIWDTSWLITDDSIVGQFLHVLVGYVSRPSGVQLVAYAVTIISIGGLMLFVNRSRGAAGQRSHAAAAAALVAASATIAAPQAQAGFKVYTPYVDYHELEIEYRPSVTVDGDAAKDNEQSYLLGIGYGVTEWWFTEVYGEWEREAGSGETMKFEAVEWENRFQLTDPGEYWADLGLLVEYSRADSGDDADKIELGLLAAKPVGKFDIAWNLKFVHEVGSHASDDTGLEQALQVKYRLDPMFEPGIELYSEFGAIGSFPATDNQEHFVGPVAEGKIMLDDRGTKLKYNVGYLFGLTDETPDGVVKATIELEFPL